RAAREAEAFCLRHGQDARVSSHIALCIEEMAGNVIRYGFQDRKKHHLSVLILSKPDRWVLRFRDDCRAFDPVRYMPADEENGLGIRLVRGLARDVYYTYSMNLNNLALILPKERSGGE
ncbi:MAG: ATP-binding protein, partial [Eubacteriales bacterium]